MKNLVSYLAKIKDPRKAKGIRHDQTTTLVIMIMGRDSNVWPYRTECNGKICQKPP